MLPEGIQFRDHPIHPALRPFVKCIWSMEGDEGLTSLPRERILPDCCVELVFHFQDPFRTHFASGTSALQPRSFVVGQMNRFLEIEPAGGIGFVAVRFHARGAYSFFARPLSEVAAGVVALEDLWPARAGEWTEKIATAPNWSRRLQYLDSLLLGLLRENRRSDRAVDRALEIIEAERTPMLISRLAAQIGVSCRQLSRQFQGAIGVSPKEYLRVSRFLRAVRLVSEPAPASLAEIALECGYYDQAHFNHEFREFAGLSPGQLASFPISPFELADIYKHRVGGLWQDPPV